MPLSATGRQTLEHALNYLSLRKDMEGVARYMSRNLAGWYWYRNGFYFLREYILRTDNSSTTAHSAEESK